MPGLIVSEDARTALDACETTKEISNWAETKHATYGVAAFLNDLKFEKPQADVSEALRTAFFAVKKAAAEDTRLLWAAHNKIYPPT
jgi:hypothetical protein